MLLKAKFTVLLLLIVLCLNAQVDSVKHITLNGQLTAWSVGQPVNQIPWQFTGRFVPTVLGDFSLSSLSKLDFEASINMYVTADFEGLNYTNLSGEIKLYRVWMRYSGQNWEVRAGLQKINFGSAKMFRPLMWFDGMDVRDPLQLTDGVYGALGRYYFPNSTNIWFWTLIANENTKGYEMYATDRWKPEVGGRFQLPLGRGQLALSTNYRKVQISNQLFSAPNTNFSLSEERVGLDGKWDIGIGLWFESSVTLTNKKKYFIPTVYSVQDAWNIGADYTFNIGNGLGATVEYFRYHLGERLFTGGTNVQLIGTMFTYPVSMLDNLTAMVFYVPNANKTYNYLSWSRTYDNWTLYGIGFWNPEMPLTIFQTHGKNIQSGKGIQLIVNYNF